VNLLAAVLALALQDPAARSSQVPAGVQARSDAYLDSGAAEIVRRARARKAGEDRSLLGFRALATQRLGVGISALRRERILYHHELVARVEWRRGDTARVYALGARAGVPMVRGSGEVPDGLGGMLGDLAFDPDKDLLRINPRDSVGGDDLRNPLGEGSEAHYRFRSGDTTVLAFPDGRSVRVIELLVIPRRADFWLVAGSFWFDAASYGLVRAVFRMARPFDLALDADSGDSDDVPGALKPIRVEIRFVTIEYGLQAFRWWLPRIIALDGVARAGSLLRIPVRFERVYTEYQVDGGGGLPPARPMPLPERAARAPAPSRPARERARVRAEVRIGSAPDSTRHRERHERGDSAFPVVVVMPSDTAVLAESPYLPPAIFDPGQGLVSETELREIGRAAGLHLAPPFPARAGFRWAPKDPTLLRYNRVEGLSFGARLDAESGALALDASARIGWADRVPNADLGLTRSTTGLRLRLGGHYRLAAADPAARPFGVGNSLGALLFGRDDGDYFRALGAELTGAPALARPQWITWRLYAERQRAVEKETDAGLARLFDGSHRFRDNVAAARADQLGANLTVRGQRGADPARLVLGADVYLEGATGTFDFARGALTTRVASPLPLGFAAALELAAGSSLGTVPPQSLWYLGGPTTLRGYGGAAAVGESFWRGRLEVAARSPAARFALFGDAGWAGARRDFADNAPFAGKPLLAWGVGASFLDGLVRLDLARGLRSPAGWRVDLYWDGAL